MKLFSIVWLAIIVAAMVRGGATAKTKTDKYACLLGLVGFGLTLGYVIIS